MIPQTIPFRVEPRTNETLQPMKVHHDFPRRLVHVDVGRGDVAGGHFQQRIVRQLVRIDPREAGIDYVHQRDPKLDKSKVPLKFAVIEHASGGVSSVDYDADGRSDIFFADGRQCRLYRNVTPPGSDSVSFRARQ